MVKKLSKEDIKAIKRLEDLKRRAPFITYGKGGRLHQHKSLAKAKLIARGQALLGKRGFVDRTDGKFTRSIVVFEPKTTYKRVPTRKRKRRGR